MVSCIMSLERFAFEDDHVYEKRRRCQERARLMVKERVKDGWQSDLPEVARGEVTEACPW